MSFHKERLKLHSYYKKVKVGMIQLENVPEPYYTLLLRYYFQNE